MLRPSFVPFAAPALSRRLATAAHRHACRLSRAPPPLPAPARTSRGAAATAVASALPKDAIPKQTTARGVPRETADRVLSRASAALRDWSAVVTDFLTPPESEALAEALGGVADLCVERWGGYASAERAVLVVARADVAEAVEDGRLHELVADKVVALAIEGNFLFDAASHPDFLGAILGCGITRAKVGDIIVIGDRGAQVIVGADVVECLTSTLTSVRTVTVRVERIEWDALQVRPPSVKEMTVVEASMRLDAVASAGFGMSRSKLADLVKSGACQKNYVQVTQPAKAVQTGDVISVRGRGKLEIGETSITAKKRFRVNLKRFV
jgi:photosystem II S4 domain protein